MDTQHLKPIRTRARQSRLSLAWAALLIVLLLAGLVMGGRALAQPARQAPSTLKIGYIGQSNSDLARGIGLAIKQINEAGGAVGPNNTTYLYELVVAEASAPEDVPTALQNLSNEGVIAIFGPDDDALALPNVEALSAASVPVLTAAASDVLYNQDAAGNVFRIVAPEGVYSDALADYLVEVLRLRDFVIIQTDASWTEAVLVLTTALSQHGANLLSTILVSDSTQLLNNIRTLPELNAEGVIMYGSAQDAATVLGQLRANNWTGKFAYRTAQQGLTLAEFSNQDARGVIGVDSWTFGATDTLGTVFVSQYVAQYGSVPGPLSVAGYDSLFALNQVVRGVGASADSLRQGLSQLRPLNLVRGPLDPATYGGRDLSHTALIYELTGQGGAQAITAYDDGVQRAGAAFGGGVTLPTPTTVAQQPTATFLPTPTPQVVAATPTPSFVTATVTSNVLNIRTGPGTVYEVIGQLRRGDQVPVVGANADYTWLVIQYRGQIAWISREFVSLFDPSNLLSQLPIVPPPPTPTPGATATPTIQPEPDLVITNATFSSPQATVGVPFTVTVFMTNQGGSDAGPFALASTFQPGGIYVAQNLPGLLRGQTASATLVVTFAQTGSITNLAIVMDLNNQVAEGTAGEANNLFNISYKVDRSVKFETQKILNAPATDDLSANTVLDVNWDGTNLTTINGALIGLFSGQTYQSAHYDLAVTTATGGAFANPQPGAILAFKSDEGLFGVIRIDGRAGNQLTFTYRIYNP